VTAKARSAVARLIGPLLVSGTAGLAGAERAPARRFIVAFELSGARGFEFSWPHASLPRFPEDRVLLVVESMPRALDARHGPVVLSAARHLKINGALRSPRPGTPPGTEEFLVALEQGRLRLAFEVPDAVRIDPTRPSAVIRLYKAETQAGGLW
jgi:hypothetical protein